MPLTNPTLVTRQYASTTGTFTSADQIANDTTNQTGVLTGASDQQTVNNRIDGTGVGAAIFRFSGNYAAQNSNISEWFGGRQQTRMRCTTNGGFAPAVFTLPGTTALNTAFDQLVTAGLDEVLRFVIEYTGPSTTFLSVQPRSGGPQIQSISSIPVRSGVAATVEITRTSGTISQYVFDAIGAIGDTSGSSLDAIKLISPVSEVWDASSNGPLPSTGVVKGNAYRVVNAPSDGSGRFDEVMQDGDYVVWDASSFTSWTQTPHNWFVLPAHDVHRISALEGDFLTHVSELPHSDRNAIIRGAPYADTAGEIRLKIYPTQGDYDAADLNTTGDIDEYHESTSQTGYLGVRLTGLLSAVQNDLPSLYVYSEDASGNFVRLLNLQDDFAHQGDFTTESDYLSTTTINYEANTTLRIYVGDVVERYSVDTLVISESNLDENLQGRILNSSGSGAVDEQRLSTLESKVATLFPLTPDITDLTEWSDIFDPAQSTQAVSITDGYSLIADYRGSGTRYESAGVTYDDTGTNVVTYTGLGDNQYRTFGFKVTAPADQTLLWIVDGSDRIPYIDMTSAGNYRVNNYTPATTEDQVVTGRPVFGNRTSGVEQLTSGGNTVSTFTLENFPSNATNTERYIGFDLDIYVNGTDTQAGDLVTVSAPTDNIAQSRQTMTKDVYLGPLHGNRTVRIEFAYEFRVSGSDLLVDFRLLTAPSDVTVSITSFNTSLSYTAPATVARVDEWLILTDEAGDYTFTGENELIVTFHPHTFDNATEIVPVAVDSTGTVDQLNDATIPQPEHSFASVEIPDTIEFRTFSPEHFLLHRDLANLLANRTDQWCYGLALLRAVTEHAVSEAVDFTDGLILISPNSTRYKITVANDGSLVTTAV